MKRSFNNINIVIEGAWVTCRYTEGLFEHKWQLELLDRDMIYTSGSKTKSFAVANIKEFLFEIDIMGTHPYQQNGAIAYLVLKSDPNPVDFFKLLVEEKVVGLGSKSYSYALCQEVLTFLETKYGIPYVYKLSVDITRKRNGAYLVLLAMPVVMIIMYFIIKYSQN